METSELKDKLAAYLQTTHVAQCIVSIDSTDNNQLVISLKPFPHKVTGFKKWDIWNPKTDIVPNHLIWSVCSLILEYFKENNIEQGIYNYPIAPYEKILIKPIE